MAASGGWLNGKVYKIISVRHCVGQNWDFVISIRFGYSGNIVALEREDMVPVKGYLRCIKKEIFG